MSSSNDTVESVVATQIGSTEQLIAARESHGWSVSDVAAKLGMMPRQIEAIEQARWDALPGHAFVRGALRAYGKALRADVGPLLGTLGAQAHVPELRPSASLEAPLPRRGALGFDNGGSGSRLTWILLGLLGLAAIAMYFGQGGDLGRVLDSSGSATPGRTVESVPLRPQPEGASSPNEATPSAPGSPGSSRDASPAVADPVASTTTSAALDAASGRAASTDVGIGGPGLPSAPAGAAAAPTDPASGTSAPSPPASSTPATVAATDADALAGAAERSGATLASGAQVSSPAAPELPGESLQFRFERESWVEVRDATGRVLLVGTQPAQSSREIAGRKPYSITVGNAQYVQLQHAGRAVDLGSASQRGVARMKIE